MVQHFNARAFHKPHFQQAAFDFLIAITSLDGQNAPDAATPHQAQGLGKAQSYSATRLEHPAFLFT